MKKENFFYNLVQTKLIKHDLLISLLLCEIGSKSKILNNFDNKVISENKEIFENINPNFSSKKIFQTGITLLKKHKKNLHEKNYNHILFSYWVSNFKIREIIYSLEFKEIFIENINLKTLLIFSKNSESNYNILDCLKFLTKKYNEYLMSIFSNTELQNIINL